MIVTGESDPRTQFTVIALVFFFLALLLIGLLFVGLRGRALKRKNSALKKRQGMEERLRSFDAAAGKEEVERD